MKSGLHMERAGRSRAELKMLDVERGAHVFALWKNVIVGIWAATADPERVTRFAAATAKATATLPGMRSNVHIVVESAGLPGDAARSAFSGLMSSNAKQLACIAVVVQGTGFWSGAIRSATTQMRMQSNVSLAHRIFGSVDEVSRWLPGEHERRSGVALAADDLREVLTAALEEV
jgi:hypothetical protein